MPDKDCRRIAVIAIHGVGDHQPEEMAKAAGGMLESRRTPAGESRYEAFSETPVRINIAGVQLRPAPADSQRLAWGPLDALRLSGTAMTSAAASQKDSIDHLFMEGQLSRYKDQGPEDACEFLRLRGTRKAEAPIPDKQVDVYDMFWSDLSGVSKSGLRVFGELYQLLFHLGSIGVNNVAAAAAFFREKKGVAEKWDAFTKAQKFAAGMLALTIPFLNLILLVLALTILAMAAMAKLPAIEQWIIALIAVVVVIAAIWANFLLRRGEFSARSFRAPLVFAVVTLVCAGTAAALKTSFRLMAPGLPQAIVAGLFFLLALAVTYKIVSAYERRRPGAAVAFRWTLAVVFVFTPISFLFRTPWVAHYKLMAAGIRAAEVGFWLLVLAWIVFWGGMSWAMLSGRSAVKAVRSSASPEISGETERARRANWTARLTIGLPAMAFLLVTFSAWAGLLYTALPLLPCDSAFKPATQEGGNHEPVLPHCQKGDTLCYAPLIGRSGDVEPARTWAGGAFYDAGMGFMPVLLLLTLLAAVIALYGLAPSIVDEVSPPSGADPGAAEALGNWLDQGFRLMRLAGRCLYIGVFLFPIVMAVVLVAIRAHAGWITDYVTFSFPLGEALGVLVGGGAVGVLAFGGRLSKLALGLRTAVRVGLDVDNWLREHPRGVNPTARICARYVSLLRHIAQWRDEHNQGYNALVIFAHSQGTVITADLLRFLHVEASSAGNGYAEYDPALASLKDMKIHLFTVGCPLQQLYGLRFPYIYGYANASSTGGPQPEPSNLGITSWTNAYRTGDYIGRSLWRPDSRFAPAGPISPAVWNPPTAHPANVFVGKSRAEFAVGRGAHTHYWDGTADQVAETLDALIAHA